MLALAYWLTPLQFYVSAKPASSKTSFQQLWDQMRFNFDEQISLQSQTHARTRLQSLSPLPPIPLPR